MRPNDADGNLLMFSRNLFFYFRRKIFGKISHEFSFNFHFIVKRTTNIHQLLLKMQSLVQHFIICDFIQQVYLIGSYPVEPSAFIADQTRKESTPKNQLLGNYKPFLIRRKSKIPFPDNAVTLFHLKIACFF